MKKKIVAIFMAVGLWGSCLMGCSSTDACSGKEGQAADPGQVGGESLESLPEAASDSQQVQGTIPDPGQGTISDITSEMVPDPTPEITPDPQPEITLVMVGDILLHTRVAESGRLEEGGYDFSAVFDEMRDEIKAADLALVNQEVIIGGEELGVSGYPSFNAPYELGDALVEAGFDVVLHATNHALDKGKRGIVNCLAFWEENYPDIAVLGIHGSEEEKQEIYLYEQDGIKIAILNYTYGTNGIPMPADMPYVVDMLEREQVISDLQKAEELADFVIVCPHWGTEYTLKETKVQQDWAALFVENGADLVLGTHAHVIEPIEWVGEEQGAPVYYSLGNFVNWTEGTGTGVANRMVGGMAKVTVGPDDEGNVVVKSYGVEPLVCHVEQGFGGVKVYPLSEYTEKLASRNEIVTQDAGFSYEYCVKLAEEVFGDKISDVPDAK